MSREIATLSRSLNDFSVDRLDTCNEVTLGLCSTLCVTLAILAVFLPVFDVAGMSWIGSWEGQHNMTWPTPAPTYWVDMPKIKAHLVDEYKDRSEAASVDRGFDAVDSNHDQRVTEQELQDHSDILGVDKEIAPSVYKRMDPWDEGSVTKDMWMTALAVAPESAPTSAPTTSTTIPASATTTTAPVLVASTTAVPEPEVPEPVATVDQWQSNYVYEADITLSESYTLEDCQKSADNLKNDRSFPDKIKEGIAKSLQIDKNRIRLNKLTIECKEDVERRLPDEDMEHDASQGLSRSRWLAKKYTVHVQYDFVVFTDSELEKDEAEGEIEKATFVESLSGTIREHPAVADLTDGHIRHVVTLPPLAYRKVPPEIVHFKKASLKAEGSLQAMCKHLDLSGSRPAKISMDEFITACKLTPNEVYNYDENPFGLFLRNGANCTEKDLKSHLFHYFDQDKDHEISEAECEISLEWLSEQLRPLGNASTIMSMNDLDRSGSLDEEEFSRLADLTDPPVPRGSMALLFYDVDADEDGFVSLDELRNTEACANPVTCAGIVRIHSVVGDELAQYDGITAILSGVALIYYKVPADDDTPSEKQADILGLVFKQIFNDAFGSDAFDPDDAVNVHDPESTSLNLGPDDDFETKRRKVQFNFGGKLRNGGQFHRDIQNRERLSRFYAEYSTVYKATAFLYEKEEPALWCKMEVNYYGEQVQDGHLQSLMLQQHFGTTPDSADFLVKRHYQCEPEVEGGACSEDGSPPFYLEELS